MCSLRFLPYSSVWLCCVLVCNWLLSPWQWTLYLALWLKGLLGKHKPLLEVLLENMQYMMPKGALCQCQPSLGPYFSSFIDLDVCLIYTLSGISEHSSSLGRSALARRSHQSFNSPDLFGAVRWCTVTRVFGNASRFSPPVKSCVSLVCVRSGGVRQS